MYDNGNVIPGLNEDWTLLGAKLNEWIAGVTAFFISQVFFTKPATAMPLLLLIMLVTTVGLATLRKRFPDEEKGMRNYFCTLIGVPPPGIPLPSSMQPLWSGAPNRQLNPMSEFETLNLGELFISEQDSDLDD